MQDRWIIIGCGGHARSIADVIIFNDENADIIFLDEKARPNEKLLGYPVVAAYNITEEKVIVGLGDNLKRKELSKRYYNNLANVVSKNAYVSKYAKLGKGVFIAHKAHVGVLSEVNDFAIVNTGADVDHECFLGEASFIGPNSALCGKVSIGENTFLGAGVTVIPEIKIGKDITIGAGALVNKNINDCGTYVGVPAEQIK